MNRGLGQRGSCRITGGDVEVMVGRVVGDVPGYVKDGTKDFELETLDAWDVG